MIRTVVLRTLFTVWCLTFAGVFGVLIWSLGAYLIEGELNNSKDQSRIEQTVNRGAKSDKLN